MAVILLINVKMPTIGQPAKRHFNDRTLNAGLVALLVSGDPDQYC